MNNAGENWLVKAKFKNSIFSILTGLWPDIGRPGLDYNLEIQNRRPNHGVNTFPKIIWTACRKVLMQSALCSSDLGECFRCPEHDYNIHRNFLEASEAQEMDQNWVYTRKRRVKSRQILH